MMYAFSSIIDTIKHNSSCNISDPYVKQVCIHTDNITLPTETLFAALPGALSNGHLYISKAYDAGVRSFLVSDVSHLDTYDDVNYIDVRNVLSALQSLAEHHRKLFSLPVVSITGSNGKTIIKEWLYQMLYQDQYVVKSPKSYNSQIGVPLSLFQINKRHTLGIFEAGISQVGEMQKLANMIRPTVGIFTNIGSAHDSGFTDRVQKIEEKAKLFTSANTIIYCKDHRDIHNHLQSNYKNKKLASWSAVDENSDIYLYDNSYSNGKVAMTISIRGHKHDFDFHLRDAPSLENIMHCITLLDYLGLSPNIIKEKIALVSGLEMRLEMKAGIQGCTIINDAYSADLSALKIALDFMQAQAPSGDKGLIISKLEQSGMSEAAAIEQISHLADHYDVSKVYYISGYRGQLPPSFARFGDKYEFLEALPLLYLKNKTILIKGARSAKLEEIVNRLSYKGHSTCLTIDLDALAHNVRTYKSILNPATEIIAVIKAGAYGTGSVEVARLLAQNGVTRLAVAFVDEAVLLRQQGVLMPIIVFNADINTLPDVLRYDLQLEVYGQEQLHKLYSYTEQHKKEISIHLKLDTGMHRLGFTEEQLPEALSILKSSNFLNVETVFSHLAGSESSDDDTYTEGQFLLFDRLYEKVCTELNISPKRHILNSSGITRFVDRQYDMVRLGLGLYGIDGAGIISDKLRKVHSLVSTLLQVKMLRKDDSVGYNRNTTLEKDTLTGVVNIGYADGLMRNLGNGKYAIKVNGAQAPILGNVSMDLIIVDLTSVNQPVVGMEVIIFDESQPIEKLAAAAETIPYEIMSGISERVERRYVRQ